jgi:hypothetical protein
MLRTLVDFNPDTGPLRIDFTAAIKGRTPARPIAHSLWAAHGADQGCLLQNTLAAHMTAEKRFLCQLLALEQCPSHYIPHLSNLANRLFSNRACQYS